MQMAGWGAAEGLVVAGAVQAAEKAMRAMKEAKEVRVSRRRRC
jgi:hypothetical protein